MDCFSVIGMDNSLICLDIESSIPARVVVCSTCVHACIHKCGYNCLILFVYIVHTSHSHIVNPDSTTLEILTFVFSVWGCCV